jgi:hypothetical protein
VWVMDNYFPDTRIRREGDSLLCWIEEHLYTKYWEHKLYLFSGEWVELVPRVWVWEGEASSGGTR